MGKACLSVEAGARETAAAKHLDYLGIFLAFLLEAVILKTGQSTYITRDLSCIVTEGGKGWEGGHLHKLTLLFVALVLTPSAVLSSLYGRIVSAIYSMRATFMMSAVRGRWIEVASSVAGLTGGGLYYPTERRGRRTLAYLSLILRHVDEALCTKLSRFVGFRVVEMRPCLSTRKAVVCRYVG